MAKFVHYNFVIKNSTHISTMPIIDACYAAPTRRFSIIRDAIPSSLLSLGGECRVDELKLKSCHKHIFLLQTTHTKPNIMWSARSVAASAV